MTLGFPNPKEYECVENPSGVASHQPQSGLCNQKPILPHLLLYICPLYCWAFVCILLCGLFKVALYWLQRNRFIANSFDAPSWFFICHSSCSQPDHGPLQCSLPLGFTYEAAPALSHTHMQAHAHIVTLCGYAQGLRGSNCLALYAVLAHS